MENPCFNLVASMASPQVNKPLNILAYIERIGESVGISGRLHPASGDSPNPDAIREINSAHVRRLVVLGAFTALRCWRSARRRWRKRPGFPSRSPPARPPALFFPVGQAIAGLISHPPGVDRCDTTNVCGPAGLIVSARTTEGAQDNLIAVNNGDVESGLAQSDIIAAAVKGQGPFQKWARKAMCG